MAPRRRKKQETVAKKESELFVIDHIVEKKRERGVLMYRVRWLKFTEEADTWELASKLRGLPAVKAFEELLQKRSSAKRTTNGVSAAMARKGDTIAKHKRQAMTKRKAATAETDGKRDCSKKESGGTASNHSLAPLKAALSNVDAQPVVQPLISILKRREAMEPSEPPPSAKQRKILTWEDFFQRVDSGNLNSPPFAPNADEKESSNAEKEESEDAEEEWVLIPGTKALTPPTASPVFSTRMMDAVKRWSNHHHVFSTCVSTAMSEVEDGGGEWSVERASAFRKLMMRSALVSAEAVHAVTSLINEEEGEEK